MDVLVSGSDPAGELIPPGSLTAGRGDAGLAYLLHPVVPMLGTGLAGVVMASPVISDH